MSAGEPPGTGPSPTPTSAPASAPDPVAAIAQALSEEGRLAALTSTICEALRELLAAGLTYPRLAHQILLRQGQPAPVVVRLKLADMLKHRWQRCECNGNRRTQRALRARITTIYDAGSRSASGRRRAGTIPRSPTRR